MSIKRPSKSSGPTVRRPAASLGVRHAEVMAPRQMIPGETYPGWLCKNKACGLLIAVALPQAGSKPASAEAEDQLVLKCPHCADENLYRWSALGEHKYPVKSLGS